MKSLTSSSPCTIFERISDTGRGIINVSHRPKICFSFRSRDERVPNFGFLQLASAQHKVVLPVHALPSETKGDVGVVEEPRTQQTTKLIRVKVQLQKYCMFGDQFHIVGDDPSVGSWNPSNALPMTWSDEHVWTAELDIPAGKSIQFKFILKGKTGDIIWQPGSDRILKTWENMNGITVCEDWENAHLQKIIEEEQSAHSDKEINSEMSTVAENSAHRKEKLPSNVDIEPGIKDSKTRAEQKPLIEPEMQQIVAENISSSHDISANARLSTDMLKNDAVIPDHGNNGIAAPVKNQNGAILQGNLLNFEGDPVLVPGLTSSVVPSEETAAKEVGETKIKDTSVGGFEFKDQNMPEFNEKQESDDDTAQETSARLNGEQELLDNEFQEELHLSTTEEEFTDMSHLSEMEKMLDSPDLATTEDFQPVDGNILQNDIRWGLETLRKFLTVLGLL